MGGWFDEIQTRHLGTKGGSFFGRGHPTTPSTNHYQIVFVRVVGGVSIFFHHCRRSRGRIRFVVVARAEKVAAPFQCIVVSTQEFHTWRWRTTGGNGVAITGTLFLDPNEWRRRMRGGTWIRQRRTEIPIDQPCPVGGSVVVRMWHYPHPGWEQDRQRFENLEGAGKETACTTFEEERRRRNRRCEGGQRFSRPNRVRCESGQPSTTTTKQLANTW